MPQVNLNADDYAAARLNIFFPAHNNTPADGNLTGQCVTLVKWFMAEMSEVPDPFSARGHARSVGRTLVNQGHAVEVPYSDRRRGDIITNEYGDYGHIYVQLSGGRVFEENANFYPQVARRLVDGAWVYASRIGRDNESFRHDIHVYRLKTYKEGAPNMPTLIDEEGVRILAVGVLNRPEPLTTTPDLRGHIGGDALAKIKEFWYSPEGKAANAWQQKAPKLIEDLANKQTELNNIIAELNKRPTDEQFQALTKAAADAQKAADKAQAELAKVQAQQTADQETGNSFLRWLGGLLNKNK